MKNLYDSKEEKSSKSTHKLHENSLKKIFQMKNQYMIQKKNNLSNTHKLHKNSKTYLDVQNEFAPKLKLSWVVSDPTQT